jgi:hypothetical protein
VYLERLVDLPLPRELARARDILLGPGTSGLRRAAASLSEGRRNALECHARRSRGSIRPAPALAEQRRHVVARVFERTVKCSSAAFILLRQLHVAERGLGRIERRRDGDALANSRRPFSDRQSANMPSRGTASAAGLFASRRHGRLGESGYFGVVTVSTGTTWRARADEHHEHEQELAHREILSLGSISRGPFGPRVPTLKGRPTAVRWIPADSKSSRDVGDDRPQPSRFVQHDAGVTDWAAAMRSRSASRQD